jgi:hypothetical protein
MTQANEDSSPQQTRDIATYVCVMPSLSPPPLTTFHGFLKRIDMTVLTDDQRLALSIAAPEFSTRLVFKHELDILRAHLYSGAARTFDEPTSLDRYSARRYAGGDDLGRGRYYTLAKNADGDDDGTLTHELAAYRSVYWSGQTIVEDSLRRQRLRSSNTVVEQALSRQQRCIIMGFRNSPEMPHRYWWQDDATDVFGNGGTGTKGSVPSAFLVLPYEVATHTIEGTLDLRQPSAQQWLVTLFTEGRLPPTSPWERPHRQFSFIDLLRYLLSPVFGGGLATEIVGAYLRRLGVAALIYPSARANASVLYGDDGETYDEGWNLVDFRGASLEPSLIEVNREVYEIPLEDFLETTQFARNGRGARSWQRMGVPRRYFAIEVEDLARIFKESSVERERRLTDYEEYWRVVRMLGSPAFKAHLAASMTRCGLAGTPDDIPMRMWQYVLHEVPTSLEIPILSDPTAKTYPLGLSLIDKLLA